MSLSRAPGAVLGLVGVTALVLGACSTQQATPTAAPAATASLISTSPPTLQPLPSVPPSPASLPSVGPSPAAPPAAQASPSPAAQAQVLLSVRQIPAGGGPAAASAASPGASPAASPAAAPALPPIPDAVTQPLGSFTMDMEVLASAAPSQYGLIAAPGCVTDSIYKRGMRLVFRFALTDMDNDRSLTSDDNPTISIQIPNAPALTPQFNPRGAPGTNDPDAPWTWVAVWNIAPDYPLGPVNYSVQVSTPDGRSATLKPISYRTTLPTIVE